MTLAPIDQNTLQHEQRSSSWWEPIISPLSKEYLTNRERRQTRNYEIRDGILYNRIVKGGRAFYRLCLPATRIDQVLLAYHDDVTAGHLGVTRTLDKIRKRYYWPKMSKQIISHVLGVLTVKPEKYHSKGPPAL